jgi:UDPglucose 6-dehydrogenase
MRNIAVAGTGYVGLSTGTCFADMGNRVTCLDISEEKIEMLRRGESPIYEPGLSEMIARNVKAGRLHFTTSYEEALAGAEYIFICVGTPSGVDGEADLQYVRMAAESVAKTMKKPLIVINKSTVPVGTGDWVADIIKRSQPEPVEFAVVSCPEFTREGSALHDFMNPDRVVIGSRDREAAVKVAQLHLPLRARIVMTDLRTAEMIKYASNAFLATKISFINEIAVICEKLGADVEEVAMGMGFDKRIGAAVPQRGAWLRRQLLPQGCQGAGAHGAGAWVAPVAAARGDRDQPRHAPLGGLQPARDAGRPTRRQAHRPAGAGLQAQHRRHPRGAGAGDRPHVAERRRAGERLRPGGDGQRGAGQPPAAHLVEDPYDLAENVDALMVCTEWNEFKQLDLNRLRNLMARPVVVDGRNIYDPKHMREIGFVYKAVGRGQAEPNGQ